MNKRCKQCTKVLPDTDEFFRVYTPRGKGLRKSTVGRNTVCRECEKINNTATRIWKLANISPKETEFLEKLADYYKALVDKGGAPIGAYAKHVLDGAVAMTDSSATSMDNILQSISVELSSRDAVMMEYDRLLKIELIDEPDVYQEMLDQVREQSLGADGRVTEKYKDKFEAVATRFDKYEDEYDWE